MDPWPNVYPKDAFALSEMGVMVLLTSNRTCTHTLGPQTLLVGITDVKRKMATCVWEDRQTLPKAREATQHFCSVCIRSSL